MNEGENYDTMQARMAARNALRKLVDAAVPSVTERNLEMYDNVGLIDEIDVDATGTG